MPTPLHPCLSCGVCCTNFRVEFSVYELQSMGGTVPDSLTHEVNGNRFRMNGTATVPIRCVALGELPHVAKGAVGCTIYEQRSRPCRDFPFASPDCHAVRAKLGKPALSAAEVAPWLSPEPSPEPAGPLEETLEEALEVA